MNEQTMTLGASLLLGEFYIPEPGDSDLLTIAATDSMIIGGLIQVNGAICRNPSRLVTWGDWIRFGELVAQVQRDWFAA